jgi:hypothetical protein
MPVHRRLGCGILNCYQNIQLHRTDDPLGMKETSLGAYTAHETKKIIIASYSYYGISYNDVMHDISYYYLCLRKTS